MNERLLRSPIFKQKVINIIDEWGYNNNLEPTELFECPETCYDPTNINEIEKMIGDYDNELNIIDQNIDNENENYNLYDKIQSLKDNYNNCGEQIQDNLLNIENRYNDFFYYGGYLASFDISESKMEEFLKSTESLLDELTSEYLLRIKKSEI